MSLRSVFESLGAPLATPGSWGAVRPGDGAVFLRVWQDRYKKPSGRPLLELTRPETYRDDPENAGYRERLGHVELIRQGAPCYLVMCRAADEKAEPRKIASLNEDEVFVGGALVELEGDTWIENRGRLPVKQAKPAAARPAT